MKTILLPILLLLVGCGGVSNTQFLASEGKASGGFLTVVEADKQCTLTKGSELDYVYKDSKGIDRSIPIHLTQVSIGSAVLEQTFSAALLTTLEQKGFTTCKDHCNGRHYAFQVIQTGMHGGNRAWNWIGVLFIAVPTSTTRIKLEGKLQDPDGHTIFLFADKRASKAFASKGDDTIRAEVTKIAEDIAFELAPMRK